MNLEETLNEVWEEIFPSNVEVLSAYRKEREIRYPGAPTRQFIDWLDHQQWMRKQSQKYLRMVNNHRILLECEEAEQKENQEG